MRETPTRSGALLWLLARRRRNFRAGNFTPGESGRKVGKKWESGHHNQMTRDRIHRRVQRINAVSVQPLVRRGGAESIFRSAAVAAVTSMWGVADVASF